MSTTTTQTQRIRDISAIGSRVEFATTGLDEVTFQAVLVPGATVGALVLTVQVRIAPGEWEAVPSGAVTVSTTGVISTSTTVTTESMGVLVSTAGTSGVADIYMHGRAAV